MAFALLIGVLVGLPVYAFLKVETGTPRLVRAGMLLAPIGIGLWILAVTNLLDPGPDPVSPVLLLGAYALCAIAFAIAVVRDTPARVALIAAVLVVLGPFIAAGALFIAVGANYLLVLLVGRGASRSAVHTVFDADIRRRSRDKRRRGRRRRGRQST